MSDDKPDSLKDRVMAEGMKLATHPAVAPLLSDQRVMKLVMQALSVPGKIEELSEEQRNNLIRILRLATEQDAADLRRTVRALEDEVAELRREVRALKEELSGSRGQG